SPPPGRAGDAGGRLRAAIALDNNCPADHLESGPFDGWQLGWNNLKQKMLHASPPPAATVGAAVPAGQRLPDWQTFFASHIHSETDARAAHQCRERCSTCAPSIPTELRNGV